MYSIFIGRSHVAPFLRPTDIESQRKREGEKETRGERGETRREGEREGEGGRKREREKVSVRPTVEDLSFSSFGDCFLERWASFTLICNFGAKK